MYYRVPDFDLRPRRVATPMPMLSTLQVDDDGDSLDSLAASAVAAERESDARHIALGALPLTLSSPSPQTWAVMRPSVQTMPMYERWMLGSVLSVGLALFGLFAAMAWRIEHPSVHRVEGVAQPVRATPDLPVDALSSASP